MPLPFGSAAQMQARSAQLNLDQEVTRGRIEQMKQMLKDYTEDELQLYDQEEAAEAFSGLLLELEAAFFELASKSETIGRYLGERKAQEKGMSEIVADKMVPIAVRQYMLFLGCREIQRARNYLFAQGQSGPSVKEWKRKLRDNLRKRIHEYLQLDKNYREERTAEECTLPVGKVGTMQKKKQKALARGINLNRSTQQRKRQKRGTASETKQVSICERAKDLILKFEHLFTENAKFGDLATAIAAAVKQATEVPGDK